MVGKVISHYRILEKLGEGGMGVVYKAEDTRLKRIVALKFLPHGLQSNEPERARFLQEAQAASALNHPNVCTIYDIAEAEDQQFIAMEYVDGRTLRHILPVRSIQGAVGYAIQIGEALHEAHLKGIIHRVVKTDNIMVNSKDQIKVMDFGLARLKGSLKLTKTSSTIGTLAYMAPEQIEGKETDARSDIFSFGVVLYEMLTGHLPFRGEHEAAMMYSIVNEPPEPLQTVLPDAPSELLHVICRALEKDPEDRYQTIHDMVIDLRRLRKETTRVVTLPEHRDAAGRIGSGAPKRQSRRRLALYAGSALGAVGAIIAVLLLSRGPQLNPEMKSRVLQLPFRNVSYGCMSEDGNWIVFPAADERGKFDVYMMNIVQGEPRRITHDSCFQIYSASLSPDASTILYSRRTTPVDPYEIVSVSSLGGAGRVVVEDGYSQTWAPGGGRFAYLYEVELPGGHGILEWWSCKPDGSDRRLEIADTLMRGRGIRVAFRYSPDGKQIAWTKNFPDGHSEIMVRDRDRGTDRQLTHDGKFADDPLWSRSGHILYSSNRGGNVNLWMIPAGGGEPVQVTRGSGPDAPQGITPDGTRLMYSEVQDIGQIRIASLIGDENRQLTVDDRERGDPSISPSGRYVAFPAQEVDAVNTARNIYVMDRDGGNVRKLTDGLTYKTQPRWSPDEQWIIYSGRPGNEPEDSSRAYLIRTDRPGPPKYLGQRSAVWITEESFVLLGMSGSYLRSIAGTESVRISEDSVYAFPVLNGTYLVGFDWREGRRGWWITSMSSSRKSGMAGARQLTRGVAFGMVDPGTGNFFYTPAGTTELHRISLPDGRNRLVKKFPGLRVYFSVSRGARDIAYTDYTRKMRFVLIENVFR